MAKPNIFIDTNILIDILEDIEGARSSMIILQLGLNGDINLFISELTLVNIMYICRKSVGSEVIYDFFSFLKKFINIPSVSNELIFKGIDERPRDFEDYIQYVAAKSCNSDYIVTRNIKDFSIYDIESLTPEDYLLTYKNN